MSLLVHFFYLFLCLVDLGRRVHHIRRWRVAWIFYWWGRIGIHIMSTHSKHFVTIISWFLAPIITGYPRINSLPLISSRIIFVRKLRVEVRIIRNWIVVRRRRHMHWRHHWSWRVGVGARMRHVWWGHGIGVHVGRHVRWHHMNGRIHVRRIVGGRRIAVLSIVGVWMIHIFFSWTIVIYFLRRVSFHLFFFSIIFSCWLLLFFLGCMVGVGGCFVMWFFCFFLWIWRVGIVFLIWVIFDGLEDYFGVGGCIWLPFLSVRGCELSVLVVVNRILSLLIRVVVPFRGCKCFPERLMICIIWELSLFNFLTIKIKISNKGTHGANFYNLNN